MASIEAATVQGASVYLWTLAAISAIPCLCSLMEHYIKYANDYELHLGKNTRQTAEATP